MKKKLFLSFMLFAVIAAAFAAGAWANSKINLIVNGKVVNADVKVINNTSYVPLRAVAKMLGAKVQWLGATNTIKITSNTPPATTTDNSSASNTKTTSNTTTDTQAGHSRKDPAAIGTNLSFNYDDVMTGGFKGTVSIDQVIRGADAWTKIQAANMFNDQPKSGYEYMLVKATVNISSVAKKDAAVDLNSTMFTLVSSDGQDYDISMAVAPDPTIDSNMYAGASHSGWMVFQVKKDDANPLITFDRNFDGSGGLWFKTVK